MFAGAVELRDAKGALVKTVAAHPRTGSAHAVVKSASGRAEVWSFTVPEKATFKFFAPAVGVWADRPDALPTRAADAVRSPVVKIERAVARDDVVAAPQGVPLADFLKAHPAVAKIVAREADARLAWAKKGEWTKLYADKKAQLERLRATAGDSEIRQKEIMDETNNLPPLEDLAGMEARVLKMSRTELERYAFCNAFVVLYGVYPNNDIGGRFFRCRYDGADMAAKDPEVYWWIYKKAFEQYVAGYMSEMKLGYRDFTLICDDDGKLDKLLPILEKFVVASIPEDMK